MDVFQLMNRGTNPNEIIEFWQNINEAVNWKSTKCGKKSLAALKKPLAEALQDISPNLYKQFEDTNKLYSRFKKVSKSLRQT